MARYRRKPVEVKAWQFRRHDTAPVPKWVWRACPEGIAMDWGDWVVTNDMNGVTFMSNRQFRARYEVVQPDDLDHQRPTAEPVATFDGVDQQELQSVSGHDAQDEQGRG